MPCSVSLNAVADVDQNKTADRVNKYDLVVVVKAATGFTFFF